jgi:hypothetical protein
MAEKLTTVQRLIKYGFIKKDFRSYYQYDEKRKIYKPLTGNYNETHADQEFAEEVNVSTQGTGDQYYPTGFPRPFKRYKLITEAFNQSIEEPYFWVLGHFRQDLSFFNVDKITDIFSASENSAFFGQSAQRLGIQQDRASQYLATIGKLTKDFFPLIRELRILDERLVAYRAWTGEVGEDKKTLKSKSADVTLKGLFVDFAEGGSKNPASVYGLSQQVGFTILPDLFFNTPIYSVDDIDRIVDDMKWNPQVKNILKRKLYQFITWTKTTHEELENRRRFTLKYLRQHWHIVRMYISWIKPYLRTVKRLTMNEKQIESPDLINSFETSMTEIEILARKPASGDFQSVILATFNFRTKPTMQYRQDFQQGPIHVGRVQFELRAYGWTAAQIDAYKRMKQEEEIDLLDIVDASLKDAMDSFGEEIIRYLEEAGEEFDKPKEEKKSTALNKHPAYSGAAEPVTALFKGFAEIFGALLPFGTKKKEKSKGYDYDASKKVAEAAEKPMFIAYKNFKKSHGMLSP